MPLTLSLLRRDRIAWAVLAAMIVAGMLVPIYVDEVGWRLQERAGFDGVDKLYSLTCGARTVIVPPWFLWPARWWSALWNGAFPDPLWVRVSGVGYALGWLGLLARLMPRATPAVPARAGVVGLLSLGLLPWLLVWSRPEQPIMLATTATLLIALAPASGRLPWRPLVIAALWTIALSYHVKALVLAPVFAVAILVCPVAGRRAWASRLAALALLAVTAISGARYWATRLSCPDDPVSAAQHAAMNLGLGDIVHAHGLLPALATLARNISLFGYVRSAAPSVEPNSYWVLPEVGLEGQAWWGLAIHGAWLLAVALLLVALGRGAWTAWTERRIDSRWLLAGALLAGAMGWSASQLVRNAYEASFELPLLALALLLALGAAGDWLGPVVTRWSALMVAGAIASAPLVLWLYGPSLLAAARHPGWLPEQEVSLSAFGYERIRPAIMAAARRCGIANDPAAHGVVIDEVTYFALMRTSRPDHVISVFNPQWRGNIADPLAYMRAHGSAGAVVGCRTLTPEQRRHASAREGVCCVDPAMS